MATTLRGLTAKDRQDWEKKYQTKLQGLTQNQRDDLFHAAAMYKMFGHRPDYNNIVSLPKFDLINLYNNQTYLNDFYNKLGSLKEFKYRDGYVTADYLNETLSDEAKIKLAKDPRFQSNFEIDSRYEHAIRGIEDAKQEDEKPGFWSWFRKAFGHDPEGAMDLPGQDTSEHTIKSSAEQARNAAIKFLKDALEDAMNEDHLRAINGITQSGEVDNQLKLWEQERNARANVNPADAELYDKELLQQAEDTLSGTSIVFNGQRIEMPGSNYYNAFKDTDVFKDFTNADKLRMLAKYKVLENKKGSAYAMDVIESDLEQYVNKHQTAGDWARNTAHAVWNGGVANIANKLMGYEGAYVELAYGKDGLGKWLNGIDPETNQPMTGMFENIFYNPNYWRKVEDYNTFDPEEHKIIDANGGISPYQNVYGTHSPSLMSWQTANEALKMMKFAWSDYLVARVLGAGSKWITGKAGGKFAATGEFMAKESPLRAKWAHGLGTTFILGTSAVGISEAYGKMTFDQIQSAGYGEIMKQVNAEVQQMVNERMYAKDTQLFIQNYVHNKALEAKAQGASDEEIEKNLGVWEAEANYYTRMQLTESLTEQQKAAHQEDFDEADADAAIGYMVDATLEQGRMMFTNAAFRKYIFDRGTRASLSPKNPYLKNTKTTPTGMEVSTRPNPIRIGSKKQGRGLTVRADRYYGMAGIIGNGFFSNYLDDVTVGFGKGFGNSEFHNYMAKKYDPAMYDKNNEDIWYRLFVTDLGAAIKGAEEASMDYQSFYDGVIGALGSTTTVGIRPKSAIQSIWNKTLGVDEYKNKISRPEKWNKIIMNPLLDSYAEARRQEREANRYLIGQNKTIEAIKNHIFSKVVDKEDDIEDISNLLTNMNAHATATHQGSLSDAIDAKTDFRFTLMYTLDRLANSPVYEHNEWVKNTRQQIKDLAEENISEEDKERLIDQFINQPENKVNGEAVISREDAWSRMVENAKELQLMSDNIHRVYNSLKNDPNVYDDEDYKQKLVYQRVTAINNAHRLNSLEEKISGKPVEEGRLQPTYDNSKSDYAEFGTHKAWELKMKTQEARIKELKDGLEKQKKERAKLQNKIEKNKKYRNNSDASRTLRYFDFTIKTTEEGLREAQAELQRINNAERIFLEPIAPNEEAGETISEVKTNEEHGIVLSKEEILALDPVLRAEMLDKSMLNNYSLEQQAVIKELLAEKIAENASFSSDLTDSAVLYERVRNDAKSYQKFVENPIESALYEDGFKMARLRQLYSNILRRKTQEAFDLITDAINNNRLEEYLEESMLQVPTIQQYIDEMNPSDEVKDLLQKHIDKIEDSNDNLDLLANDVQNDENLSTEDKRLLSDAIEFLRQYNIDPTNTDDVYVALTTGLIDNPNMTAFESYVNANNTRRLIEDKVRIRPEQTTDSEWSQEANDKIHALYTILTQKAGSLSRAKEVKADVEQPRTTNNEGSGESSAPVVVEPTLEPTTAPVQDKSEHAASEEPAAKPADRYKARLSQEMLTAIPRHGKFNTIMDWLKQHPDAEAEDLEGYINESSSAEDSITTDEALDFVAYFRTFVRPGLNTDTNNGPVVENNTDNDNADNNAELDKNIGKTATSIKDFINNLVNKISGINATIIDKVNRGISAILDTTTVLGETITSEDKFSVLKLIETQLKTNESNITSYETLLNSLKMLSSVLSGKLKPLINKLIDSLTGEDGGIVLKARPDSYDLLIDPDHPNEGIENSARVASVNMEAIVNEFSDTQPGMEHYSPVAVFIKNHGILLFLQQHDNRYFKDRPIYFVSPLELTNSWVNKVTEEGNAVKDVYTNDAPLVAVVEVNASEGNNTHHIIIDGKHYQPVALMPSTNQGTPGSQRLGQIRSRIELNESGNPKTNTLIKVDVNGSLSPISASFYGMIRDEFTPDQMPQRIEKGSPNKSIIDAVNRSLDVESGTKWAAMSRGEKYANISSLEKIAKYCMEHLVPISYVPADADANWTGIGFTMTNGKSDGTKFTEFVLIKPLSRTLLRGQDKTVVELLQATTEEEINEAIDNLITHAAENNSILSDYFKTLKTLLTGKDGLAEMLNAKTDTSSRVVLRDNKVTLNEALLKAWINKLNTELGYSINIGKNKYSYHVHDGKLHIDLIQESGDYIDNILVIDSEDLTAEKLNRLMFDMLKHTVLNENNSTRSLDGINELAKWNISIEGLLTKPELKNVLKARIMDDIFEVSRTSLIYPKSTFAITAPFTRNTGEYKGYQPSVGNGHNASQPGSMNGSSGINTVVAGKTGKIVDTVTGSVIGDSGNTDQIDNDAKLKRTKFIVNKIQKDSEVRQKAIDEGTHRFSGNSLAVTTFIKAISEVRSHDGYAAQTIIDLNDSNNPLNPIANKPFTIGNLNRQITSVESAYYIAKYAALIEAVDKVSVIDQYGGQEADAFFQAFDETSIFTEEQRRTIHNNLLNEIGKLESAQTHEEIQQALHDIDTEISKDAALKQAIDKFFDIWNDSSNGIKQSAVSHITEAFLKSTNANPSTVLELKGSESLEFASEYINALNAHTAERTDAETAKSVESTRTDVSTTLGDVVDEFLRDFFDETFDEKGIRDDSKSSPLAVLDKVITDLDLIEIKKTGIIPREVREVLSKYPNMSLYGWIKFYKQMHNWKTDMQRKGYTFISKNLHMDSNMTITVVDASGKKTKRTVGLSGEMDLLAYNKNGEIEVFDFKTKRFNSTTKGNTEVGPVTVPVDVEDMYIQLRDGTLNPNNYVGEAKKYAQYLLAIYDKGDIFKWKNQLWCYGHMVVTRAADIIEKLIGKRGTVPIKAAHIINITLNYDSITSSNYTDYNVDKSTHIISKKDPVTEENKRLQLTPVLQPVISDKMMGLVTGTPIFTDGRLTESMNIDVNIMEALQNQKAARNEFKRRVAEQAARNNGLIADAEEALLNNQDETNEELPAEPATSTPDVEQQDVPVAPKDEHIESISFEDTPPVIDPTLNVVITQDYGDDIGGGNDVDSGIALPSAAELEWSQVSSNPKAAELLKTMYNITTLEGWTKELNNEERERILNCAHLL